MRDAFIVREAAEAINDAPIECGLAPLAGKLASAPGRDEALVVRALNANFRLGDAPRAQALANYAVNDKATPEMRAEALKQLALWGKVPQRDRVVGHLSADESARGRRRAWRRWRQRWRNCWTARRPSRCSSRRSKPSDRWSCAPPAPALVGSRAQRQGCPRRCASRRCSRSMTSAAIDVLQAVSAAEKSSVPALRLAALQIVAHRAPERAMPVIKRFAASKSEGGTAGGLPGLGTVAGGAGRALAGRRASISSRRAKWPPAAQVELIDSRREEHRARREGALGKAAGRVGRQQRSARAVSLRARGRQCPARRAKSSSTTPCCPARAVTRSAATAARRVRTCRASAAQHPPEYLLEAIVKPSAHIAPGFDIVTFTLANGATETGSVVSESATADRAQARRRHAGDARSRSR